MTVGDMIREMRLSKNLTQKQLGDMCGMADSAIRRYENGRANPKLETLKKIADALGTSIDVLLGDNWNKYLPAFLDDAIKRSIADTRQNLHLAGDQAQQHAHEIVDSDWKCVLLLHDYEKLNTTGRNEAQKRINELTEMKKYTESKEEIQ